MRGHVRRRGRNSWAAVIYLGRGPNGKDRYKWYAHATKREADAHLNVLLSQGPIGQAISPAKLRVAQYLHQRLDAMDGRVQPTTMRTYRFAVERYIILYLGQISLLRMTAPAIEEWLNQLHKKSLLPATVHQAHRVLREAMTLAFASHLQMRENRRSN